MILKYIVLVINLLFISNIIAANDYVISQGNAKVTVEDLDGMAFRMPNDVREGYFNSPKRIESTLVNILNMKHVYSYAVEKNLLDLDTINAEVNDILYNLISVDSSNENVIEKDIMYKKIRNYILLKETYRAMQRYFIENASDEKLLDLAKENYMLNRLNYTIAETRNLAYVSIAYNEKNKSEILNYIKNKMKQNKESLFDVDSLKKELSEYSSEVKLAKKIEGFYFTNKSPKFSEFLFQTDKLGIIEDILDVNSKFIIMKNIKIIPSHVLTFDDVKNSILEKLKEEKIQRDFNNLLYSLSKDEIKINKEAIAAITTRYKNIN